MNEWLKCSVTLMCIIISNYSLSQIVFMDTQRLNQTFVLNIESERMNLYEKEKNDIYNSVITLRMTDSSTMCLNYKGQPTLYFGEVNGQTKKGLVFIRNNKYIHLIEGRTYDVKLVKQCGPLKDRVTYYDYFVDFYDKIDCSIFKKKLKTKPKISPNGISNLVDTNCCLYEIYFEESPK